ncbi:MAG: LemA family protein [Bdellovibrionales bacterium]
MSATVVAVLVLAVLVVMGVIFVGIYNGLVRLRSQLERAWANIDVILKQRYDEIPQLVQVVEQYVGYENNILKDLANARSRYGSAGSVHEKIEASRGLSLALQGVMAIGEAYPELKSNANFMQLQKRVSELEEAIAHRRETYNEAVANFNARIDQFPDTFAARLLNYQRQESFMASANERSRPSLKMNLPNQNRSA